MLEHKMIGLDQYRLAFNITPVPMVLVSKTGEIVLTNDQFDQLFEYESESLIGRSVETLIPSPLREHHSVLRDAYFRVPAKRRMGQGRDLNGISRTGRVIALELGLDTVTIDDQIYAMLIALDIDQRKQHERRMNTAMDASASAMIMVDTDGCIKFVNKAAQTLFGYREKELLNTSIERLVPNEFRRVHPVYRGSFLSTAEARPMAKGLNLYAQHSKGHQIPVEIALTPVDTPDGKMVVSTIIDLSERIIAQTTIDTKNQELLDLDNEIMQFTYSASHDLKAPISTMVGLLDLCIDDLDDGKVDEVREHIQMLSEIGHRGLEKINNVLEIARLSHAPSLIESIDLEDIVNTTWTDLSGGRGNVQLQSEFRHGPFCHESHTITTIISNLFSNALRYQDHGKAKHLVEFNSKYEDDHLIFSVSDNGIGIPEDSYDKVFTLFKRIDERSENGLGLGLVKKLIDRHHGHIDFVSTSGKGTVFTVTLPLLVEDKGLVEDKDVHSNNCS